MDEEINPINRNTSIDFQGCVPLGLAENYNFFDPNPSNHSDYSKTNHVIPIDHSLSIDENTIPIQYNENYNFSINSMFDQVQTNINHYYAMVPLDSLFSLSFRILSFGYQYIWYLSFYPKSNLEP